MEGKNYKRLGVLLTACIVENKNRHLFGWWGAGSVLRIRGGGLGSFNLLGETLGQHKTLL